MISFMLLVLDVDRRFITVGELDPASLFDIESGESLWSLLTEMPQLPYPLMDVQEDVLFLSPLLDLRRVNNGHLLLV